MSGGVDSSVNAALLRQQGFAVTGFFMKLAQPDFTQQLARVRQVAARLAVPLEVVDLSAEFATTVLDYFCATYFAGRTPNPCMVCNRTIKFGRLLEETLGRGLDGMATGHYARLAMDEAGNPALRRGLDPSKDQSYFLARLGREQLARLRLPLGDQTKAEVYRLAAELGITGVHGPESQDVCFLKDQEVSAFLQARARQTGLVPAAGPIVTRAGRRLGTHAGLYAYTIGQRRGLGIPDATPYYVIALDREKNAVVVGKKADLLQTSLMVREVNWLSGVAPALPLTCQVKIRYRHRPATAELAYGPAAGLLTVRFPLPQEAITPGQFAVFYREDLVLGSGEIMGAGAPVG